jgi:tRNA-specific adenosine deaminase 3
VNYAVDTTTGSIRYTTVSDVESDQELTIFYGHNLWFDPVDSQAASGSKMGNKLTNGDACNGGPLPNGDIAIDEQEDAELDDAGADEEVAEDDLPFVRIKPPPEEEEMETIRTS